MSPGHSKMPSDSIKVVPGRSKLRVESSNPVARGTPMRRTSKVMLITPEEAVKLSSGFNQVLVPPVSESPRPKIARATPESPRPKIARATPESPRPKIARATSESPRPVLAVKIPEALRPVPAVLTPEASRPVLTRPTFEPPRSVTAHSATGLRKKIVCGLPAMSLNTTTVRRRTNPRSFHQSTDGLPPSPRALQIRSRIKQQAATTATHTVEGTVVEVGDKAKDHDAKETCQPASNERISELLRYLPALHPTWKGRIVDSASLPEFDCEFCAKPASNISRKALRLSKAMPTLLEVELLPTGHILNDVFNRSPRLSDVELYLFSDEKEAGRVCFSSKREHAHLFEAMSTRNAMIKANINGTELLIFSSKLLDKTSQFFLKKQYKAENYLWGFFLHNKPSQAPVPGSSYQTDRDVVDMDIDTEYPTPNLALKLIAESQSIPSSSPVKRKREVNAPPPGFEKANKQVSVPPGFEKIWTPPLVTLNIHGTSNALSGLTGSAGLVRNESGKWVFGYSRCHKSISEAAAVLLAIYHGLKLLWDSGCRRIRLQTTSLDVLGALTTKPDLFYKRKSILGLCKDMILKSWECDVYHVAKEENSCAEWLASRLDGEQIQGLVFFEYPPLGLVDLLEKDRLAAIK
ncbi:uncharacterized protein LOC106439945 isoform X1 [Brassica napus]|uniref:uncharacterized protein LOC106439945 isoform X1 n=1 Tax=Brassica napus TaxID=3708 RepID=UPI0020786A9C|nr:uncharacterized protein LOC106439945 isoform X1 [Brassica napus]XP_022572399.2 uncharacterized protein LOC106439945 isoform X1 [Brassica napus]